MKKNLTARKTDATKEQIIAAMQECARKVKRSPTVGELRRMTGFTRSDVCNMFGTAGAGLRAAGLDAKGSGHVASTEKLLLEWAELARRLGKLPSIRELEEQGTHSITTYLTRFRLWTRVGFCFRRFAEEYNITGQWQDVLDMVRKNDRTLQLDELAVSHATKRSGTKALSETELKQAAVLESPKRQQFKLRSDRPVYGALLPLPGVAHEPVNEAGVVFMFGMVAHTLGLVVHRIQTEFPDCEAMLEVEPSKWQRVRIEFEYVSKNFALHKHNAEECDLIVCWTHNWPECPENLEVIELSKVVRAM